MILEQPTALLSKIYPKGIFRKNPEDHSVYLTFDDGPIPEVTPWVLDILDRYGTMCVNILTSIKWYRNADIT